MLTCLLQGKTVSRGGFLARVTKGGFPVPTSETFAAFEDAIRAKPERGFRLIALVQAAADQSENVRNAVLRLAKAGLSGLALALALASPNRFDVVAWSGVRGANERPLSRLQPGARFALLQAGSHRQLVDEAGVAVLMEEGATRPARPATRYPRGRSERRVLVGSVHLYATRYSP